MSTILPSDIPLLRLTSQHITGTKFTTAKQIVSWMGAMQAQDYPMAKWAVGVRLPGSTDLGLEAAISNGEILRTHLLRPTWHFVAAEDIYWLLDLTAPQIKAAQSARERDLELSDTVVAKSNSTIEKALSAGRHLTREELISELRKAGIATDQNRASHLFARAEMDKITCSGATRNGKTTYALLSERVPKTRELIKDEALAELARRYFTSRSPATVQDFMWWSGLPAGDVKLALELVKSEFHAETIVGRTYWLSADNSSLKIIEETVYLLPTYDEFILSYNDRSASITTELESHMKAISDRGVFRPIIVVNGHVLGIWKRTLKAEAVVVELQPFIKPDQRTMELTVKAATQYGDFLGQRVEVIE